MWVTVHVAISSEEARAVTELLERHNIAYKRAPGPIPGTAEILVPESDLKRAEVLLQHESSPTTGPSADTSLVATPPVLLCLRCNLPLQREGSLSLQVGYWFTGYFDVEIFSCPRCGHLEFFQPEREFKRPLYQQRQTEPQHQSKPPLTNEDLYNALCQKAAQLIEQGQLQAALGVYEQIAQEFAHDPSVLEEVRRCMAILQERLARENAESAEEPKSPSTAESPLPSSEERYEALRHKATSLRQSGQWRAAIEVYQQIMREFPHDLKAWEEADRNIRNLEERLKQER